MYRHIVYLCLHARKRKRKIIKDLKKENLFFLLAKLCAHIVVERYFPIFVLVFSFLFRSFFLLNFDL